MNFVTDPWDHQREAVSMSLDRYWMALFMEMGTGKTKTLIDICRQVYNSRRQVLPTLIFSPLVTLYNWKEEILRHSRLKEDQVCVLSKSGAQRIKKLKEAIDLQVPIVILNYEALRTRAIVDLIHEFAPTILVCDESHLIKNYKSKQAKEVVKIADKTQYRYLLTGTPMTNDASDLWMQYRVMDGGETFGKNFFQFRANYFNEFRIPGQHFSQWTFRKNKSEELSAKLAATSFQAKKKDCLDLPPLIEKDIALTMGKDQNKHYQQMKRDFLTFVEENQEDPSIASTALAKAIRLQQIASGFVKTESGQEILLKDNVKLATCKELLERIAKEHKVIIWCGFIKNYDQLSGVCEELGLEYCQIVGGQNLEKRHEEVQAFQNDPDKRVMIANRKAGGTGINLTAASYSINYSRDFNLVDEKQSEARNHRGGSDIHEKITKINLVYKDTIDMHVLSSLRNKDNITRNILDLARKL